MRRALFVYLVKFLFALLVENLRNYENCIIIFTSQLAKLIFMPFYESLLGLSSALKNRIKYDIQNVTRSVCQTLKGDSRHKSKEKIPVNVCA